MCTLKCLQINSYKLFRAYQILQKHLIRLIVKDVCSGHLFPLLVLVGGEGGFLNLFGSPRFNRKILNFPFIIVTIIVK